MMFQKPTENKKGFTQIVKMRDVPKARTKGASRISTTGFTMIEMVVYVAVLAASLALIVNTLLLLGGTQNRLATARSLNRSALTSLERITREAQSATSIDIGASALGVDPGQLTLIRDDGTNATTTVFFVEDDELKIQVNDRVLGSLVDEDAVISSLVFRRIPTGFGEAVRTTLSLEAGTSTDIRTETFYTTSLLRNAY